MDATAHVTPVTTRHNEAPGVIYLLTFTTQCPMALPDDNVAETVSRNSLFSIILTLDGNLSEHGRHILSDGQLGGKRGLFYNISSDTVGLLPSPDVN